MQYNHPPMRYPLFIYAYSDYGIFTQVIKDYGIIELVEPRVVPCAN
jgi:hypothetical protein